MAEGVDVSRHQGTIDWAAARRGGIAFAYIKLTEGTGYLDPAADAHLTAARAGGVLVGGYHFARPDTNPPEADATAFATALKVHGLARPGVLPPCLDMERAATGFVDYVAWSKRFLATLRGLTGYQPVMIYASSSWWKAEYLGGGWLDDNAWAWVAHYGATPGSPGFKSARTVMHQYTAAGTIPGYSGTLDRNTCWVDLSTLTAVPPAPGGTGSTGVELMERITVTPPNKDQNSVRVFLSGSPGAAIVVRPRIGGDGYSAPMWIGDIFAWGNDHQGVGHNPTQIPGYNNKLTSHRRYDLPGALWADVNYSAAEPFDIDLIG